MTVHSATGPSAYERWLLDGLPAEAMPKEWRTPRMFWPSRRRPTQELYWDKDWTIRMLLAGRGAGKSFAMAEMAMDAIEYHGVQSIAAVGRTGEEVRDVLVKQALVPAATRRFGEKNVDLKIGNKKLHVLGGDEKGGATFYIKSAEIADSFRGYNFELVLADEWCFWKDIDTDDNAWENLLKATRIGAARFIIATSPVGKRFVREMRDREDVYATTCSSFENRAFLTESFYRQAMILKEVNPLRYRQEYLGEIVEEVEDAMWTPAMLDAGRMNRAPEMAKVVVSIDPAGSAGDRSDHTGIIVLGRDDKYHGYVLHSERVKLSPKEWAARSVELAEKYGASDLLIETSGAGAAALKDILLDASTSQRVNTTTPSGRGSKWERATPVSMLYAPSNPRMHHIGDHRELEEEMKFFTPESSANKAGDDLVDSLTQAVPFLSLTREQLDLADWEF